MSPAPFLKKPMRIGTLTISPTYPTILHIKVILLLKIAGSRSLQRKCTLWTFNPGLVTSRAIVAPSADCTELASCLEVVAWFALSGGEFRVRTGMHVWTWIACIVFKIIADRAARG